VRALPLVEQGSDACSFQAAGVPVLAFTTGQTDDYHKRSDTPDTLNYAGMAAIAAHAAAVIEALATAAPR
jgi:hypothetical protein